MYILNSIGLRQLLYGRPEKVERIICELEGEVKERFLFENMEKIILKKSGRISRVINWENKVGILTKSKAPRMSMKVLTKNSFSLKEWYMLLINIKRRSMVAIPFLKAKRFDSRIELCSKKQSSRVLSIYSKV